MNLSNVDWLVIAIFFAVLVTIGCLTSKRAGANSAEFFLSGNSMPWWALGISMAAATTSTNSANLFTEIIRKNGISGNWVWWAFLLTGMLTVFVYAKLWHRTGAKTDIEFYELRYSGKAAAFLRGFRALYLGVFFNTVITALVILGAIKIGVVMFDISPLAIILITAVVTVIYSALGGMRGIVIADFFQFVVVLAGSLTAAVFAVRLPQVNGFANLVTHPDIVPKLQFLPDFADTDLLVSVFIIPVAIQWWNVWYPGSEPGGGGYIAQRMLSAKNERQSVGASLFFNAVHYGLRPWPWYIVAFCSLLVFPDLDALRTAFPNVDARIMGHDLAYPAMLTLMPAGITGLVVASLLGALLSTLACHLNWGSSYVVNDVYKRFVNPEASEHQLVLVGRITTVGLMALACLLAPFLESAKTAFDLVLQIGAGTGLLFLLRWFWWRINAFSEITAMAVSFIVAVFFQLVYPHLGGPEIAQWQRLIIGIVVTTVAWVGVTYLTRPVDDQTLFRFCTLIRAGGPGWKKVEARAAALGTPIARSCETWPVPSGLLCMSLACCAVYAVMFAVGSGLYGYYARSACLAGVAVISTIALFKVLSSKQSKEG
ncbi:MAG: Na+:solute symporter [Kiritimatiellae bacterium]|nr:Na+:solute symporter [Kiritimatiellia bacterium]